MELRKYAFFLPFIFSTQFNFIHSGGDIEGEVDKDMPGAYFVLFTYFSDIFMS